MSKFPILVLLAFGWVSLPSEADDGTDLRQSLEKRYAALKAAMDRRDADALSSILATDFVTTDIAGRSENAAQMLDELSKVPTDPSRSSRTTLRTVTMKGGVAVVEQAYEMKTSKTAADGAVQNIELRTVSEDVWINSNGVWRIRSTTTDQMDYFINGKSVVHKTRQH